MVGHAVPGYSSNCASKAALSRLTESLAQLGVRVFDVSPGMIATQLTGSMPMLAGAPPEAFHSPDRLVEFVLAIASGRLDSLSGRYFHVQHVDITDLLAHADAIADGGARQLRVASYGPDDPLP
jgi:3-oxoacyl-[acyl-carrier protein] reductase